MRFYSDLAYKKLARFRQFEQIYHECCWIFCGDNGQVETSLSPENFMTRQIVTSRYVCNRTQYCLIQLPVKLEGHALVNNLFYGTPAKFMKEFTFYHT